LLNFLVHSIHNKVCLVNCMLQLEKSLFLLVIAVT
jgi:hypothetical protein